MRTRLRVVWLTGGIVWLVAAPIVAATLDLTLEATLPAPGNNVIQLRSLDTSQVGAITAADAKTYWSRARTGDSLYTVALKNIEQFPGHHYFTYEFLVWRNSGNQDVTQVDYQVTSTGSFADFFKDIPFTITDSTSKGDPSTGSINVFFPSLEPASVCKAIDLPTAAKPLRVYVSRDTEFTISLNCEEAADLPRLLAVNGPQGTKEYWKRSEFASSFYGANSKRLTSKSFDLMRGTLTPNVLAAIAARFKHLSLDDGPDDTIVVEVQYSVPPAGLERPLQLKIPVAFYPFISVIAASLSSGVVVGWLGLVLLMFVARKSKPRRTIIAALFLGFFLTVVAFLILLLAESANTRVELLGLKVNPSDVLVLFLLGAICGGVALVRAEALLNSIEKKFGKIGWLTAASLLLAIGAMSTPVEASNDDLAFVGLSSCPDGSVIGLNRDGWVIHFANGPTGAWRKAGRLQSSLKGTELNCASVDGKSTALIVAISLQQIWLIRMDLASGRWSDSPVTQGTGVGVAYDPNTRTVFVSSIRDRSVYVVPSTLKGSKQWASIFGNSESISSLALDTVGKRLLVGEAFSGTVYSLALANHKQDTVVEGMGSVNSLAIDSQRNVLYVADAGQRTIWMAPLAGKGVRKPKPFRRLSELKYVAGVAVDARSNVWAGVQRPAEVIVFAPDGGQLAVIK